MQEIIKELRAVQRTERPVGNKEWVGCDKCEKWRKVPRNFQFDRSKDFFCSMIPKMTCDTKEEPWDEKDTDASFITDEWVLFSWERIRKELVRERNKYDAAVKIANRHRLHADAALSPQRTESSQIMSAMADQSRDLADQSRDLEQQGRRTSEEQSASTESTSAELTEPTSAEPTAMAYDLGGQTGGV